MFCEWGIWNCPACKALDSFESDSFESLQGVSFSDLVRSRDEQVAQMAQKEKEREEAEAFKQHVISALANLPAPQEKVFICAEVGQERARR